MKFFFRVLISAVGDQIVKSNFVQERREGVRFENAGERERERASGTQWTREEQNK